MNQFVCCPERKAKATLKFPLLVIDYESPWVTPNPQEHEVFSVKLFEHHNGQGTEFRGPDMPDISDCLSKLNPSLVQLKVWEFARYDLTLFFTEPVAVGEHANVQKIVMQYYPWWADTEAMNQARAARRVQLATEARIAARMGM